MTYRGYHFGTAQYYAAFNDLPTADTAALRKATLEYLSSIDKKLWFNQPIQSVSRLFRIPLCSHANFFLLSLRSLIPPSILL